MDPDRFGTILAFSPGTAFTATRLRADQRVFIAHGRSDRVLPFEGTRGNIAEPLAARLKLTFRPFEGDHIMPPQVQEEGVRFWLG